MRDPVNAPSSWSHRASSLKPEPSADITEPVAVQNPGPALCFCEVFMKVGFGCLQPQLSQKALLT